MGFFLAVDGGSSPLSSPSLAPSPSDLIGCSKLVLPFTEGLFPKISSSPSPSSSAGPRDISLSRTILPLFRFFSSASAWGLLRFSPLLPGVRPDIVLADTSSGRVSGRLDCERTSGTGAETECCRTGGAYIDAVDVVRSRGRWEIFLLNDRDGKKRGARR